MRETPKIALATLFIQGARILARLGFGGASVFLKPLYLLFLLIPKVTTFGTWS